ncbi:hypothetical protein [Aquipuribacter hungaricus]|uniref:Uncharacterized protein n=1 Tax=Aquipuribacter hungaricus TaxID=545624 RepID=A0ABV7WE82_9MICO
MPASRPSWRRVSPTADVHLTASTPTAALSRVQTGVGFLRAGLLLPDGAPALRLGCAWQHGTPQGPRQRWTAGGLDRGGRSPVRVHDSPEELDVDLLAVHPLARLLVVAWPERAAHAGGGLLVVRTEGGSRVDAPVPAAAPGTSTVLLSGYVVDGELVLRAESRTVPGGPAQACGAYGYDALRWLDDHQPVP